MAGPTQTLMRPGPIRVRLIGLIILGHHFSNRNLKKIWMKVGRAMGHDPYSHLYKQGKLCTRAENHALRPQPLRISCSGRFLSSTVRCTIAVVHRQLLLIVPNDFNLEIPKRTPHVQESKAHGAVKAGGDMRLFI